MRAFLAACLGIIVMGIGGYYLLSTLQEPSGIAYSTDGARIDPQWSWRSVLGNAHAGPAATGTAMKTAEETYDMDEACRVRAPWQWIFVDFGKPEGEPATCKASQ
jgi:hypothetical protein